MKILHTSDWHLGRTLHGYSLIEDQDYMLKKLIDYLLEEAIELLIIAGDVYDKSLPSEEAVDLFNRFIKEVIGIHRIPTVVIAGNHDSQTRIQFGSELLANQGLYMVGENAKGYQKIQIDTKENFEIYVIPYMEPAKVREIAGDETIKRHDDAMRYLTQTILEESSKPVLLVAHAFVMGGDLSDSERRLCTVGTAEMVGADCFKPFIYTALGHLHKRQMISQESIRYSGSLLKYSVSEFNQPKGFVKLEIKDGQLKEIEEVSLAPKRDLKIIKGPLEGLIKSAVSLPEEERLDYVYAKIEGQGATDIVTTLRPLYPYILGAEVVNAGSKSGETVTRTADFEVKKKKALSELFMEFMDYIDEADFDEEDRQYAQEVIEKIEEGNHEA